MNENIATGTIKVGSKVTLADGRETKVLREIQGKPGDSHPLSYVLEGIASTVPADAVELVK